MFLEGLILGTLCPSENFALTTSLPKDKVNSPDPRLKILPNSNSYPSNSAFS